MELTDLATIRALCEKYDFALSKGFGQNFIVNPGVPPKIVDAAGIDRRFGVLEIGPGIGVLTKELASRAGQAAFGLPISRAGGGPSGGTGGCRRCWQRRWPALTTSR